MKKILIVLLLGSLSAGCSHLYEYHTIEPISLPKQTVVKEPVSMNLAKLLWKKPCLDGGKKTSAKAGHVTCEKCACKAPCCNEKTAEKPCKERAKLNVDEQLAIKGKVGTLLFKKREWMGRWFLRRSFQEHSGFLGFGKKHVLSGMELLWCDTRAQNYESCRVAVVWSRTRTGGLGDESDYVTPKHMSPELQKHGAIKVPHRHGIPGHQGKAKARPKVKTKPDRGDELEKKERLKDTPVANDL